MNENIQDSRNSDTLCLRTRCEKIIRPVSDHVGLCCKMDGVKIKDHEKLNSLAQDLEKGIRRPECAICWEAEDKGIFSHRQQGNVSWKDQKHNSLEIYYVNTCDLACIYCNQLYSSKWQAEVENSPHEVPEYFKNPGFAPLKPTEAHKDFILSEIRRLAQGTFEGAVASMTLLGGEPLLHTLNKTSLLEEILNTFYAHASESSMFHLAIQSNGNTPPSILEKTIKLIKDYKTRYQLSVSMGFSIESTGKNYDYVRYGGDWEVVKRNMIAWSLEDVELTVQTSINSVSLKDLLNFVTYVNEFSRDHRPLIARINPVTWPHGLSIAILDHSFKKYFTESLNYLDNNPLYMANKDEMLHDLRELGAMIGSDPKRESLQNAADLFRFFKASRKTDIRDFNAELSDYVEQKLQIGNENVASP